jgi:1,4-alpha-glucan branching enzyme
VQEKIINRERGVLFTLWAPRAKAVSVVGDFNNWRINASPMQRASTKPEQTNKTYLSGMGDGLWTLWLANLKPDLAYQFAIHLDDTRIEYLNDPFAKQIQFVHSGIASRQSITRLASVFKADDYQWSDQEWTKSREADELSIKPISILAFDLVTNTKSPQTYQELARDLVEQSINAGFTHVLLGDLIEELIDITDSVNNISKDYYYFAAKSLFGASEDIKCLINYLHTHNIGVILELPFFDQRIDYNRKTTTNVLISSAIYWLEEFHVDGFKFTTLAAKSSQTINHKNDDLLDFIKVLNESIHARSKGVVTIVDDDSGMPDISKPTYLAGLGFNMSISNNFTLGLTAFIEQGLIDTLSSSYSFSENQIISLTDDKLSKLDVNSWKILLAYFFSFPGKKLIHSELLTNAIAQLNQSNGFLEEYFFSSTCKFLGLDWDNDQFDIVSYIRDLNELYSEEALSGTDFKDTCFEWVDYGNNGLISYLRWSRDYKDVILVVMNLTDNNISSCSIGIPKPGLYLQVFNSDAIQYCGSGYGNDHGLYSSHANMQSRPYSLLMDIAARSVAVFKLNE